MKQDDKSIERIKKISEENDKIEIGDFAVNNLKNLSKKVYLFLPNIEKLFYKTSVENKTYLSQILREIWTIAPNLKIFGSIYDQKSKEFEETLGNYKFTFYSDNFRVF